MSYTAGSYEQETPLVVTYPATLQIGTTTTAYVYLGNYHRAHLDMIVGTLAQGATVNCQLLQAQDDAGTGAKVIANKAGTGNKAITQLAASDAAVRIELQTEELDVDGLFDYVAAQIVVAGGTAVVSAVLYGDISRFKPTPVANWDEVVD